MLKLTNMLMLINLTKKLSAIANKVINADKKQNTIAN